MEEEYLKLYGELIFAFSEWCRIFIKSSSSPIWTDGQVLNFTREKIIKAQNKMIAAGYWVPSDFAELPPKMDVNYMRNCEKIETEAKQTLSELMESEDYKYITENQQFLGAIQLSFKTVTPKEALEPIRLLSEAIENKNFPAMRRYIDKERVLNLLKVCRAEMEEEVEDMNPF